MGGASGSGKSKKKKKLEVDMESFAEVGDKIAPFVGYFPSGFDPIEAGSAGDLGINVFRHQTFGNRMQLVVSPGESNVDFVGSSHAGESESHQGCCTYALGVLDKETQTLKIVPIASNKVLSQFASTRCCIVYLFLNYLLLRTIKTVLATLDVVEDNGDECLYVRLKYSVNIMGWLVCCITQ